MKILIIGKNGQLGWELVRQFARRGENVKGVDLPECNITDPDHIRALFDSFDPDLTINASAYTAVDDAESDVATAFAVNQQGPAHLVKMCASKAPLIHVSTDYVFDGTLHRPYKETDPIAPLGVYGHSKALGEKEIAAHPCHIIIRTAWLCGVHGHNFVKTMLRLGAGKENLSVVNDQVGSPTFAADLAGAIISIADRYQNERPLEWGTYHYCNLGQTSWYRFAKKIFDLARPMTPLTIKTVEPIPTSAYPTPAKRPANSVLDCRKIEQAFGVVRPPWEESLEKMLREIIVSKKDTIQ